ncbi:outer-membrane lipoprotein carrier protein LolA [Prevotella sp. E9-3]|uniref:LolA-like putative outer membrane lipoprotein chaperone n=1 Tax=Prevotella sp. E9-3 TaxID=2913621 RepID=UPI001ED9DCD6|nr:LolA-like putative outer membrane lipoprotein chaperone [Prevotella sp. E9-3]UKK49384.1 outer-membrane lipoprotein carrier protein LolA [Prevotella sp. E9-3]
MKKILILFSILMSCLTIAQAQNAKDVLDKCAAVVSNKDGVKASFRMESARYGTSSGTIAIKGRKFCVTTDIASIWFDGKTQWTYLKKNDEVSVTTPTEVQLQTLNPYNFITMYKKGFKHTMTTNASSYNVHLTADNSSKKMSEMFITIDKKSFTPTEVKVLQGNKWTTFKISNLQKSKLDDAMFRFSSKDFPSAEVIDLR